MSKTCPSCGKTHEAVERCPYCDALVPVEKAPEPMTPGETKEVRVLKAKIKTRKEQAQDISFTGPGILVTLGVLICIFSIFLPFGIIFGLILIGIGIVWWNSRAAEEKRLKNEVAELEAELE